MMCTQMWYKIARKAKRNISIEYSGVDVECSDISSKYDITE